MNIFNSLGSNYNFNFVMRAMFAGGGKKTNQKLVKFLEDKHQGQAILTYKGRQAIELGLKALNLPSGSFAAICGYTCFAVYQAIKNAGLEVEYLDLPSTTSLNFNAETLSKALEKNPQIKAVIVQNTLGTPCLIEDIQKVCQDKKLILVEDLAHSVGTVYKNGQEAGMVGNMVALSFSQDKIIDAISGGALILRNSKVGMSLRGIRQLAETWPASQRGEQSRSFFQQLKDRIYPKLTYIIRATYPIMIGKIMHSVLKNIGLLSVPMNDQTSTQINKLPGWYASLALDQFSNLAKNIIHRQKIARLYAKNLNEKILSKEVVENIDSSTNLRFPIFIEKRGTLINKLKQSGIYVSDIWYDAPIAPKKYLAKTDYKNQCPNAERVADLMLNLPTHINVSEKDAKSICELINNWLQ